ncbi:MAG: hypothetical protein GY696_36645, partial [Gammaproteobacteria bacterium]|nr:hypothetical protein [Gammaproteobacteria bacterium]
MRPISVLPALSKVAERWILRILKPQLFNPLDNNQFAYLSGRSVDDALAVLEFYIAAGFRSCTGCTKVAVVSLDVRKAFDMVPPNCLLTSLKQKGLSAAELHLLRSYLSGWKQTVRVSGEDSAEGEVRSGVAQGSLLGPNLFITYISPVLQLQLS